MIICGYAGVGKSFLGRNFPGVMDLESTPFEKDWDRYAKCAIHYHNQGYMVLISCHKEIRRRLQEKDRVPFGERMTVVPNIEDKEAFRERYIKRGNTDEFIEVQMENWEKWLNEKENRLLAEHWEVMERGETLFDCIVRLSKASPFKFCDYDQCPMGYCTEPNEKCVNPLVKYVKLWKGIGW